MKNGPDILKIQELCINAILNKYDPDSFVQKLYSVLKLPIIVFDETITLIAYAFPRPFYFKDWDEIVQYGSSPKKKIFEYVLDDYQKIILNNKKPTLIDWGTCKDHPQICCSIIYNDILYGYIGIDLDNSPYTDKLEEISQLAADVLGNLLNNKFNKDGNSSFYSSEELAEMLLLNNNPASEIISLYLNDHKPYFRFCILDMISSSNTAKLKYTLGYIFKKIHNAIACTYDDKSIYILLSDLNHDSESKDFLIIKDLSFQQGFYCGISDYFSDLSLLNSYKKQCIAAINAGYSKGNNEHVYFFRDYYLDIICKNHIKEFGTTASAPYSLRKLYRIDSKENKKYIETLIEYIKHFFKLSETAEALGIHTNTVRFRLEKASEILGISIKDINDANNIYMGLKILDILNNES